MKTQDFTTKILVDQTPQQVFDAINNVRGWWSEEIEGGTHKLNDEFTYHYKDVHICRMKLTDVVSNKKVVWQVLSNYFNFTKDKSEWTGTKIVFDISKQNDKTQVIFTHVGLTPESECFGACTNGWNFYLQGSLLHLINTSNGQPNKKEIKLETVK